MIISFGRFVNVINGGSGQLGKRRATLPFSLAHFRNEVQGAQEVYRVNLDLN